MAYYQFCDNYDNAPGNVCYFCKVPKLPDNNLPVLDPGLEIEFEGIPKICGRCIMEWAEKGYQMLSPHDSAKLRGQVMKAEADRARAEKRAYKAEAAVASMQDWLTTVPEPEPAVAK